MSDTTTTTERQHLHRDDYPQTLRLLEDLRNGRRLDDWAAIGFEPTEYGAYVNWDQLANSWLSSTERAVVHIARGAAVLERAGGPAPRMVPTVTGVIANVCSVDPMAQEIGAIFGGNEWMGAVVGDIDTARLRELDPDIAQSLGELDEGIADVMLQLGAGDVTDADRAEHAKQLRRQLSSLTEDLTGRFEEWLDS